MTADACPRCGSLPARFTDKVRAIPCGGCWEWQAALDSHGYGSFKVNGQVRGTHRVAYEAMVGPVPDGLVLDHLCRNRACCNPQHLEPVTNRENVVRGSDNQNAPKTHCPQGHPYDDENTRIGQRRDGTTFRLCRECERENARIRYARQMEQAR